jgi:hypothetical protein
MKSKFVCILIAITCLSNNLFSQTFNHAITTSYGFMNPKIRVQYERPINDQYSFGANINYYFDWQGGIFEPFIRAYSKSGNDEGFFGQAKVGVGNLNTGYDTYSSQYVLNKRMITFGGGAGFGHKLVIANHFLFETYFGLRYYTYTPIEYVSGYSDAGSGFFTGLDALNWIITTGFPVELNFKIGYQF